MNGGQLVESWSSTQRRVTLSSEEAELTAAIKMSSEITGVLQLMEDWGLRKVAKVFVDSSAVIGVTQRKEDGKLRHVRVGLLWIQERVEDGEITIRKVLETDNPADAKTKHLQGTKIDVLMEAVSPVQKEGGSDIGLRLTAPRGGHDWL